MPSRPGRPRRPAMLGPVEADAQIGGPDPAELVDAAHATAEALVRHGRNGDEALTARLIALTDEHGIDEVALLWADRPADSLPGALWRLYALRAGIRGQSDLMARAFDTGRRRAPVHEAVAGVADPPGPVEVRALADAILAGAFSGDLGVALERAAAFCRVVSTGWAVLADDLASSGGHALGSVDDLGSADALGPARDVGPARGGSPARGGGASRGGSVRGDASARGAGLDPAATLTRRASDLLRTGVQLESAARRWRAGTLH